MLLSLIVCTGLFQILSVHSFKLLLKKKSYPFLSLSNTPCTTNPFGVKWSYVSFFQALGNHCSQFMCMDMLTPSKSSLQYSVLSINRQKAFLATQVSKFIYVGGGQCWIWWKVLAVAREGIFWCFRLWHCCITQGPLNYPWRKGWLKGLMGK